MPDSPSRSILFTGFPGFIGARLIPRLLEDDPSAVVVALVEPRMQQRARELAARLGADRIVIQPGDITRPRLGLDDATWDRLTADTVEVFHLAAIYDLAVPEAVARLVNVTGTERIVEFCRACRRLERHLYVSTAYVAGLRTGVVMEVDLEEGHGFKNHYEATKHAAEVVVRRSMEGDGAVPTTIIRPAIVVGDSRTGETAKFDGPYYVLRTISALHGFMPQLGSDEAPFNVVPIDFVVEAMAVAAREQTAIGETLHLVDPEPLPASDVIRLLSREFAGREPRIRVPIALVEALLRVRPLRRLMGGAPVESLRYLNHPVRFDVTNAAEVLGRHGGLRCPRFPEYVETLVRFYREHEDDPAFESARPL